MYLADSCTIEPSDVHPVTKQRTDLEVQFRSTIPRESMVHFEHITAVTIDATHACIRITEGDLQKWANKILREKKEQLKNLAIAALEKNLTSREVKMPNFKFSIEKGSCGRVSLSGSEAQLVLGERDEFGEKDVGNLFDGVWMKSEKVQFHEEVNCLLVLRQLHPGLFADGFITLQDVAELWRQSLYAIFRLLRNATSVDIKAYKLWAETYYQISVLVFPSETALTPYKLKILLYYQILQKGYLSCVWNHLTEAMEKSNHHAQKYFYSKTIMGGGQLHHQNPMLLDLFFSFCRLLQIFDCKDQTKVKDLINNYLDQQCANQEPSITTYESIICNRIPSPELEIGAERSSSELLTGMRFVLLGNFAGTTQDKISSSVENMGGTILSKSSAETILKNHTIAPHCYIVLKDDTILRHATDVDKKVPPRMIETAKSIQNFASGNWTFLSFKYLEDCEKSEVVVDPKMYTLKPGTKLQQRRVNDMRPLLKRQRDPEKSSTETTARSSMRKYRKQFMENYRKASSSESCSDSSESNTDIANQSS